MESIRGIVTRILSKNEETGKVFAVVRYESASGLIDAKFDGVAGDLKEGDFFSADGFWGQNQYKGRSEEIFRAKSVRPDLPRTQASAVVWLSGIFDQARHGATAASVKAFVDKYGNDVAGMCERDPQLIAGVSVNPATYRGNILHDWGRRISGRQAVRLLEDAGVDQKAITSVLDAYRDDAFGLLQRDPYTAARVPTFGFTNADRVGVKIGIDREDDRRIAAAVLECIGTVRQAGHTFITMAHLADRLRDEFGIDPAKSIDFAVRHIDRKETPFVIDRRGDRFVAMARDLYVAEARVARLAVSLLKTGRRNDRGRAQAALDRLMADPKFSKFDEIQRSGVLMAACEPISILTGGPGTGKSTVTEAIAAVTKVLGNDDILLCAPTGKAAKRLEEASGQSATTLHRLLEAKEDKKTGGSVFGRNRQKPLPRGCFVVLDEASMNDAIAMNALLDAMPPDGRLLLVGDRNQLPSVDAGAVLGDLLNATDANGRPIVPRTELVNVYRQSRDSRIATGAAEIRDGVLPFMTNKFDGGLTLYEHQGSEIVERIKWIVRDVLMGPKLRYKTHHISVLVPQAPGSAGAWELNRELSRMLNPDGQAIPGVMKGPNDDPAQPIPRVGDRVMLTENDDGADVMNGDVGTIVAAFEKPGANGSRPHIRIEFDCGKTVEYPAAMWRKVILAYAITIHKSQGSQYPAVIMPVTSAHSNMLDRSILYTGWTRAKGMLFLVGEREAIQAAVDNVEKSKRDTRLGEFLAKEAAANLALASPAPAAPMRMSGRSMMRPGMRPPSPLDEAEPVSAAPTPI